MKTAIVLTSAYAYWTEVPITQALFWRAKNRAEWIYWDDKITVGSQHERVPLPYVIRLTTFAGYKRKKFEVKYSKELVYERDEDNCQYWHRGPQGHSVIYKCAPWEKTIDHIVPQSQGGKNSFTNCVCCCKYHNEIHKKNHRPKQVGLRLIRNPRAPVFNNDEYVRRKFTYNENKVSHRKYMEYLGKEKES